MSSGSIKPPKPPKIIKKKLKQETTISVKNLKQLFNALPDFETLFVNGQIKNFETDEEDKMILSVTVKDGIYLYDNNLKTFKFTPNV